MLTIERVVAEKREVDVQFPTHLLYMSENKNPLKFCQCDCVMSSKNGLKVGDPLKVHYGYGIFRECTIVKIVSLHETGYVEDIDAKEVYRD